MLRWSGAGQSSLGFSRSPLAVISPSHCLKARCPRKRSANSTAPTASKSTGNRPSQRRSQTKRPPCRAPDSRCFARCCGCKDTMAIAVLCGRKTVELSTERASLGGSDTLLEVLILLSNPKGLSIVVAGGHSGTQGNDRRKPSPRVIASRKDARCKGARWKARERHLPHQAYFPLC